MENNREMPLFCPKCGLDSVEGETKCPYCGTSYFDEPEEEKKEEVDSFFGSAVKSDDEQEAQKEEEGYVPYYMRDPKENAIAREQAQRAEVSRRNGLIQKLLMLLIVLVVAGVGLNAWNTYRNRNKNEKGVEFTKGAFEDKIYRNEWAQLQITPRGNFENAPALFYSIVNAAVVDPVDMHVAFTDNDELAVFMFSIRDDSYALKKFKKLKSDEVKKAYLDSSLGNADADIKAEDDVWIAGKKYFCFSQTMEKLYGETVNAYICVRIIGNRMLFVVLYGKDYQTAMMYKQYFEPVVIKK